MVDVEIFFDYTLRVNINLHVHIHFYFFVVYWLLFHYILVDKSTLEYYLNRLSPEKRKNVKDFIVAVCKFCTPVSDQFIYIYIYIYIYKA